MNAKDAHIEEQVRARCLRHGTFDDVRKAHCLLCEAEALEYQHYLRELAERS